MGGRAWKGRGDARVVGAVSLALVVASITITVASPTASAIGGCTTNWTGSAGNGLWSATANWDSGVPDASDVACIPDVGANGVNVDITLPGSISVAGIDNFERIIQPPGSTVTLSEHESLGEIVNHGVWRFAGHGAIQGTSGGAVESFTNQGTIHKQGGGQADIITGLHNSGAIDVDAGVLNVTTPVALGETTYDVANGATLRINSIDGVTSWNGTHDATGGGRVDIGGEIDVNSGLIWAFGLDEAVLTANVDTTNGFFDVAGTLNVAGSITIRGQAFSVANHGTGTLVQAPGVFVTLDQSAHVVNYGEWRFAGHGAIQGTAGGAVESFTNQGTVHKQGSGQADITTRFDNSGAIDVDAGVLNLTTPVGLWARTYDVADGATLRINSIDGVTSWNGTHDLTGGGRVDIGGEIDVNSGMIWAFGPGEAVLTANVDTTNGFFDVAGTLNIPGSITIRGQAFSVGNHGTGTLVQAPGVFVTLDQNARVVNYSEWRFAGHGAIQGTAGGDVESFTNQGTVHKQGSGQADITTRFDNSGAIDVDAGVLNLTTPVGLWARTYDVADGATLRINSIDGVTSWNGTHDLTGGGRVDIGGEIDVNSGMIWGFGPGEAVLNANVDTTNGFFDVTGTLNVAGSITIRGQAFSVGNHGTGTLVQAPGVFVTLDQNARVVNYGGGEWRFAGHGAIQGTSGGEVEFFTNGGTIHKQGSGQADIVTGLSNTGTVHAAAGSLSIGNLEQITGATLTGGTYFADNASITLPSNVTTIGFGAAVHLRGAVSMPQLNGLTSNTGSFRLSGGKDFATAAALENSGVMVTGPGSTLTVSGTFSNDFGGTYWTEIAGRPGGGGYGFLSAGGAATLAGTFVVVTDPAFTPVQGDAYDVVRYGTRTGTFDTHTGVDPNYQHAYDPDGSHALRLTVGAPGNQPPAIEVLDTPIVANEGDILLPNYEFEDPDGPGPYSFSWSVPAGTPGSFGSTSAQFTTYHATDDAEFDIRLEICDGASTPGCGAATFPVVVHNVAPVFTQFDLPDEADVGEAVTASISTVDPGDDTVTVTIDWGDGTAAGTATTHTYTATGTYTVTACASDGADTGACLPRLITVQSGGNAPPVANAGPDRTTPEGSGVALLGSGTDPDSTNLSFSWTPTARLTPSATVAQPTFTPVDDGTTTFGLVVCDDGTPSACDATPDSATVTATNVAPDVDPIADQTATTEAALTEEVTFSDPGTADTHVADIDWGDGSTPETDPVGSGFELEHTYLAAGEYDVEVCVTDDDDGTDCESFMVTVTGNGAPDAEDDEGTTTEDTDTGPIFVLANDTDSDDDLLEIVAVTQPEFGSVVINHEADPEPDTVTYDPAPNFFGTESFTYTVSDGHGVTATATVTVVVTPVNDEPVATPGPDRTGPEGSPVTITGTATDVDGPQPLSYHWSILEGPEVSEEPSGTFADADDPSTQFTPKQDGTYVLQLEACDADDLCDTDVEDDTVIVTVANVRPTVTLPADRTVTVGVSTSVTVTFTDPGTDDSHTAVIDWGDGSADTLVDPATSPFTRAYAFTTPGVRTVRACVTDDDAEGCDTMTITVVSPVRLRITDPAALTEPDSGTTPLTFTITANPVPTSTVTVLARTVNGTATAPSDYTALAAAGQTVTFTAGQASRTVSVPIVGDLVREPNETFTVTLSSPVGATIDDGTAVGRINNGPDVCTIVGTPGPDTLNGTAGNDVICALAGNDTINGLAGNDTVLAADGNDTIRGGTGNDTLRGQGGNDLIAGEAGDDTIDGGAGIDRGSWAGAPGAVTVDLTTENATGWGTDTLAVLEEALGGAGNDTLRGDGLANALLGNDGNDTLLGRSGNDVLDGQNGNDRLRGEAGNDNLIGAAGTDELRGGDGSDLVQGQAGDDTLFGEAGSDDLRGGDGNDDATGGDGNDDIQGNDGNDDVAGNNGNDRVDGGGGVDLVNGNAGNDNALGGAGNDRSPNGATAGVHGGPGINTVNGGAGTDYCSFGPRGETRVSCELP